MRSFWTEIAGHSNFFVQRPANKHKNSKLLTVFCADVTGFWRDERKWGFLRNFVDFWNFWGFLEIFGNYLIILAWYLRCQGKK
jgi:hypothetical protein